MQRSFDIQRLFIFCGCVGAGGRAGVGCKSSFEAEH